MTTKKSVQPELKREVYINAPPETVYKYLTDPALIVKWFGRKSTFEARVGGACRFEMNDRDAASGRVVELKANEKVVYTFGWEAKDNPIKPGSTNVEILLRKTGKGTHVTLVHSGLPVPTIDNHAKGWELYLSRLSVTASGGDPGPDPNRVPQQM